MLLGVGHYTSSSWWGAASVKGEGDDGDGEKREDGHGIWDLEIFEKKNTKKKGLKKKKNCLRWTRECCIEFLGKATPKALRGSFD